MPQRRNKHLLHELVGLPWWFSLVVAVIVFAAVRWLLPAFAGSNVILRQLGVALHGYAWWFALPFLATAALAAASSFHRRRLLDDQVGIETLRALSWQDFERLVGEAYRRQGYVVEEIGGSVPDGGIDLLLHRQGTKTIVQCKRWKTAQVGVSLIREFYGVTVGEKAARGIFVTTGTYSADALAFARGKPLDLVDGEALAKLVQGLRAANPTQTVMPPAALACPKCGGEMVERLAKRGANAGKTFWGCRRYPQCQGVRSAA
jgi:restriction system protein